MLKIKHYQNSNEKQEYRKIKARALDLVGCENWDVGERIMLPKSFKLALSFDPLFIYRPGRAVSVYYNFTDPKQDPRPLLKYLEGHKILLSRVKKEFDINCAQIRKSITNNSDNYKSLHILLSKIWPLVTVASMFGDTDSFRASKLLMNIFIKIRKESDDVLHPCLTHLSKIFSRKIEKKLPKLSKYALYISASEWINKKLPNKKELTKRSKGYLYHKGKIVLDIKKYTKENKIILVENDKKIMTQNIITGQPACQGKVQGKARIIFELVDMVKVKQGDIVVAPMTTPDMMAALKKAGGIVTDEGGITCHAAIVARELRKPCIIGTKIATKYIKDGNIIKMDADKGRMEILK